MRRQVRGHQRPRQAKALASFGSPLRSSAGGWLGRSPFPSARKGRFRAWAGEEGQRQRGRSSRSSPGSSCSLRGSHHDQQWSRQRGHPSGAQRAPRRASARGEAFVARQELRPLRQGVSLPRMGTRGHKRGQGAWRGEGRVLAAVIPDKARRPKAKRHPSKHAPLPPIVLEKKRGGA